MNETVEPAGSLALRVASNSFALVAAALLGSVISFFTFVATTRALGPSAFGNFTAALVFLYVPTVLAEAGLSAVVLRELSAAPKRTEYLMRASVPLRAIVSTVAIVASTALGLALPFDPMMKIAIAISSVGALCTLLTSSLIPVLQAQLKMHQSALVTVAGRLSALALTLAAIAAGLGFKSIVAAQAFGLVIVFVLHVVLVRRLVSLRPLFDLPYWRALLAGSVLLGLAISLGQIYFRIDLLLLQALRSPYEVGLYSAAYKFIELSLFIASALAVTVFPPLARFIAEQDPRAGRIVQKAFDMMVAISAPIFVAMLLFAEEIIVFTAGEEFREGAAALRLLSPYIVLGFVNALFWRMLIALGADRTLVIVSVAILALNIVLNLALIPEYGYKAAAVTSVVSEAAALVLTARAARTGGLAPGLRYVVVIAAAAGAMTAAGLLTPGPALLQASAAVAAYAVVLVAAPGTVHAFIFESLLPAIRTRRV